MLPFEIIFYAIYLGFGAVLAFVTMRRRYEWGAKDGEAPNFSIFWLYEMTCMWPVYLLIKVWATWIGYREDFHKTRKGPPRWYDWFF